MIFNLNKLSIDSLTFHKCKYAGHDIPELIYRLRQPTYEVIDLESKKRQFIDALAKLDDTLSWYHRDIKLLIFIM
jgi:hypothetical protein